MPMIDPTDYDLDSSKEPHAVKPGNEYKLVIVEVRSGKDKNDNDYIQPRLEVVEDPYAKDFTHFLHLPNAKTMTEKRLNSVKWALKTFCEAFGIDLSRPTNPADDWPGQEGFAILGAATDDQYGEQNFIKKLSTPQ